MDITVSTMGPLRRLVPIDDEVLHLAEDATIGHAIEALISRYPVLEPHRSSLLAAMNEEWVDRDSLLVPNANLILMPPVSGG